MTDASLWETNFDAQAIKKLSGKFTEDDAWLSIRTAAESFWAAPSVDKPPHDPDVMRAWHLLVFSVGNFKRQAPITLPRLSHPESWEPEKDGPPEKVTVPLMDGESMDIDVTDRKTWIGLKDSIKGFGVATTSTLFSALWPGRHIIIDVRDLNAAIGLDFQAAKTARLVKEADRTGDFVSWAAYDWLQERVTTKAKKLGLEPVEVERALFILDRLAYAAQADAWRAKQAGGSRRKVPELPWTQNKTDLGYVHYVAQAIDNL